MDPDALSVPVRHCYNDSTVERNAGRLRVWLNNLPLLDVVKALRQVQGALDAMNEQELATEKRYQLLEVFRDTAGTLFHPSKQYSCCYHLNEHQVPANEKPPDSG